MWPVKQWNACAFLTNSKMPNMNGLMNVRVVQLYRTKYCSSIDSSDTGFSNELKGFIFTSSMADRDQSHRIDLSFLVWPYQCNKRAIHDEECFLLDYAYSLRVNAINHLGIGYNFKHKISKWSMVREKKQPFGHRLHFFWILCLSSTLSHSIPFD